MNAPVPKYTGLLGFGGSAPSGHRCGDAGTMTFVFGNHGFFGYWKQHDNLAMRFVNLPHPVPMTPSEARIIPAECWLQALRDAFEDDNVASDLLRDTKAANLMSLGGMESLSACPIGIAAEWYL